MNPIQIILLVLAGLLLLFVLAFLFGKVKVRVTCKKHIKVVASVLGVRVTLYTNEKQEAEQDLSKASFPERILKKELKRRKKQAEKAKKKRLKAAQKKHERILAQATQATPNVKENVEMVTAIVKRMYTATKGKLHIRVKKLLISVGTDDAAKTAILYGAVVQAVGHLVNWIEEHFTKLHRSPGDMQVTPDYLSGKSHAEIELVCSLRLPRFLSLFSTAMDTYEEEHIRAIQKAKLRLHKKQQKKKAV